MVVAAHLSPALTADTVPNSNNATDDDGVVSYSDKGLSFPNSRASIIGCISSFLILSWFCMALRLYTRFHILRVPGWDDLLIVLAMATGTGSAISLCLSTRYGMGHYYSELSSMDKTTIFMLFYIANGFFITSNFLVKLSLLMQYLRAFQERILRQLCYALTAVVSISGLIFAFFVWFPCFPLNSYWTLDPKGKCYGFAAHNHAQRDAFIVSTNALNMLLDFLILVLPVPLLVKKNTSKQTRMGLACLFCLGIIINLLAGWRLIVNKILHSGKEWDPTYDFPYIMLLGQTENRLSCILACVPIFWPVFSHKLHEILVTREIRVESMERFASTSDGQRRTARRDGHRGRGRLVAGDIELLGTVCEGTGRRFGHGRGRSASSRGATECNRASSVEDDFYCEDEAIEAGLRHPGRLVEVDKYVRTLIDPLYDHEGSKATQCEITAATHHSHK